VTAAGWAGSIVLALAFATLAYLLQIRLWWTRVTDRVAYFGLRSAEREARKREIERRSRPLAALARAARVIRRRRKLPGSFYRGVRRPAQCRRADFARAASYQPGAEDVFVATQMKCGTTWMQQLVYEVLSRGQGDLGDGGHRHLYAVSPWIESRWAVPLEAAPRIGERGQRIIKTHLPTSLCPYGEKARYVYVTREPVACFASAADFIGMLMGPLAPELPDLVEWFCSERMWWGPWPDHVDGWWGWAAQRGNVLFVHYEEMLADLPAAVDRVAVFLETPLEPAERAAVARKAGFAYMKAHEDRFEMAPPTPFSAEGSFLKSGRADRGRDISPAERERIVTFCRERLRGSPYPVERFYPELAR
jgi:Sulfotransferase domain